MIRNTDGIFVAIVRGYPFERVRKQDYQNLEKENNATNDPISSPQVVRFFPFQ